MQVRIEFAGLFKTKLGQESSTLTLDQRPKLQEVMLRELLGKLEETFVHQSLSLLEGGEIKPGIMLIRKGLNGGRAELISRIRDERVHDQEVFILSTVMAGG